MEEMLWTRRKSRRRRWKEDELDILSSVDSLFCFGGGRRGGGSIENVDEDSRGREGVVEVSRLPGLLSPKTKPEFILI